MATSLRVCELIEFCENEQPQLFDFVEAKFAELDVFFSQPLRINCFEGGQIFRGHSLSAEWKGF
jgi:hypothetical protein